MAYESLGKVVPLPVASALAQFTAVHIDGNGNGVAPASGGPAIGVIQNTPKAGSASGDPNAVADVMISPGFTKMVAGAAASVGNPVSVDSSGRAIYAATGDYIFGYFLQAPTASGDVVAVLWLGRIPRVATS
jgi:hypothetical protein